MGTSDSRLLRRRATAKDAHVTVRPFETGRMVTPAATLVSDAQGPSMATSWRFFIEHRRTNTKLWFDMGISHDLTSYPPLVQALHTHFKPMASKNSIEEDTISLGISPEDINHTIVSHGHWDHISPLPTAFSNSDMIVGPGSIQHCSPGWPAMEKSKFDGRIWDSSLRSFPLSELPPTSDKLYWKQVGPFPNAHDFFGDGSFYLIDAPGHMTGNIAALARVRTKTESTKWILLGGDCAHCNVFTYWPDAPFGKMPKELFPSGSLHECGNIARETIRRIAELKTDLGNDFLVWYAHSDFLEGLWELQDG